MTTRYNWALTWGSAAVFLAAGLVGGMVKATEPVESAFQPVSLVSTITGVQPGTGIALWDTSEHAQTDAIQLEFSYLGYHEIVHRRGIYDWEIVDRKLAAIAGRKHQAILRFYDTYPGKPAAIPKYMQDLTGYRPLTALSEGKSTGFPDWSHAEYQRFLLEFFEKFAERYDQDSRLAYLQAGFGLWSEYHIYDGPEELGKTFPSLDYQTRFAHHLAQHFHHTPWMISIDAADRRRAPFSTNLELQKLRFGLFDDSFLCKHHAQENEPNWKAFGDKRWQFSPMGGEFSYYNSNDQKRALAADGPNGVRFEDAAEKFHLTFLIGDDQPRHAGLDRVREAGMRCGYRFRLTRLESNGITTRGTVKNVGIAPRYFDAWPCVGISRAETTLKGLLPGEAIDFQVAGDARIQDFRLEGARLVAGQRVEFESP